MKQSNIIVCGYPKSGNTWATRLIAEAVSCPVMGFWGSKHKELAIEGLERESDFSVYKAHQFYDSLCSIGPFIKLIYIVRDPRDIACSGANYFDLKKYNDHYGTSADKYEAMIRTIVDGSIYSHCTRPWKEHVADYLERDMLLVRYEDLRQDPLETLSRIMAFIGVARSAEELKQAIDKQSFETVKKRAISTGDRRNQWFLRKGQVRSHLEELSAEQCTRIVAGCTPQFEKLGYLE